MPQLISFSSLVVEVAGAAAGQVVVDIGLLVAGAGPAVVDILLGAVGAVGIAVGAGVQAVSSFLSS